MWPGCGPVQRPRPAAATGVSVVNKLALPAFVFLLAARPSMGTSRQTHVFYPHPRCPSTRNLPAPSLFLPAIYPHPRFFLPAIYPHPWHPPPVATQQPAKPFARAYPRPARPVSPLVPRARGTRPRKVPATRHSTRTRAFSSPWRPSPVRYPHPWQYPHPQVPRARTTRRPHGARTRSLPTSSHC